MLTAEARIQTERPSRYLVQLCRHANSINHKILRLHTGKAQARPELQHVEWSGNDGTLTLTWGRCTMQAAPDTLTVRAEATSEENLQQIQNLITRNLERFGRRDHLKANWERPAAPAVQAGESGYLAQPRPPRQASQTQRVPAQYATRCPMAPSSPWRDLLSRADALSMRAPASRHRAGW